MMELAISIYVMVLEAALPFALVFCVGNLMVSMFMKAAFQGKVIIG